MKLTMAQLSSLSAMYNSVERCLKDANAALPGTSHERMCTDYAKRRIDQYFAMIDAIVARSKLEDA